MILVLTSDPASDSVADLLVRMLRNRGDVDHVEIGPVFEVPPDEELLAKCAEQAASDAKFRHIFDTIAPKRTRAVERHHSFHYRHKKQGA